MDKNLIEKHMRTLGCTYEEAVQLIQDDKDVDRGIAKPWDLTKEQMKNARKLANAGTRKVSTTKRNVTKKENGDKLTIMQTIEKALNSQFGDYPETTPVKLTNPERLIDFTWNGVKYTVSLTAHRK